MRLIGQPQFHWFWAPISFESFGVLYHAQLDTDGNVTNGAITLVGKLPLGCFKEANRQNHTDMANGSESERANGFQKIQSSGKASDNLRISRDTQEPPVFEVSKEVIVLHARHEVEYRP